jgi:hypothetical protein
MKIRDSEPVHNVGPRSSSGMNGWPPSHQENLLEVRGNLVRCEVLSVASVKTGKCGDIPTFCLVEVYGVSYPLLSIVALIWGSMYL